MPCQLADHTADGINPAIGQVSCGGREHDVRLQADSLNGKRMSPAGSKLLLRHEVNRR